MEIAFATGKDVMSCIEMLVKHLWRKLLATDLSKEPFPCMSYHEAMSKYGSDKPDTRFGMEASEALCLQ